MDRVLEESCLASQSSKPQTHDCPLDLSRAQKFILMTHDTEAQPRSPSVSRDVSYSPCTQGKGSCSFQNELGFKRGGEAGTSPGHSREAQQQLRAQVRKDIPRAGVNKTGLCLLGTFVPHRGARPGTDVPVNSLKVAECLRRLQTM